MERGADDQREDMIRYARYFLPGVPKSPIYLINFVTSRCMGRCLHCFYWKEINRPEKPLSPEETYRYASSMGDVLQVIFTGGEPYLRADFDEVVLAFYKARRPYNLGIATSGFYPDRVVRSAENLVHSCPKSNVVFGLPIEGVGKLNDEVRGVPRIFRQNHRNPQGTQSSKKLPGAFSSSPPENAR